jgi:hypothetical protein
MLEDLKRYHQSPHEVEAIDALSDPSMYEGLPRRDVRKIMYQVVLLPSFEPYRTWTVYSEDDGSSKIRRMTWDQRRDYRVEIGGATTFGADGKLPESESKRLSEALAAIQVSPFSFPETLGIDGVTFGVRKRGFMHRAELYWWSIPPDGWEALAAWHGHAIDLLNSFLPEYTPTN